ncbi:MAG TPA: MBL fold metallo-hydrolase [Stellaceae bacterium]|nr:MBL fold metallo-hydrolase [Stellaceae bacterium]
MASPIPLGGFALHEIEEITDSTVDPLFLLPSLTRETIERHAGWLAPHYYDPASGTFILVIRSWLLRTPTHNILIDTCCGNDKPRPYFPPADRLNAPYLDRLKQAGCSPDDIDFVMCTHLHVDHCGWNTRLENGRWVPTFRKARHIFSRTECEAWGPGAAGERPLVAQPDVYEDSVAPVIAAGLAELIDGVFSPLAGLSIEPAPGHSPGHCLIRAESGGTTGLFTGDVMHHPIQIAAPGLNSAFCSDPAQAARTRRRVLTECAEHGHLLVPAHFPTPAFGRVEAVANGFGFRPGL